MKHLLIFILTFCLLIYFESNAQIVIDEVKIKKVYDSHLFAKWDSITKQSLNSGYNSEKSKLGKKLYKNRLESFDYCDFYSDSLKTALSIRQMLIEQVLKTNLFFGGDFLLVEETILGEYVRVNYFLLPIRKNCVDTVYLYGLTNKGIWVLSGVYRIPQLSFNNKFLINNKVAFGHGGNLHDTEFSSFAKNEIVASDFFPRTTLSANGELAKINNFLNRISNGNYSPQ